MIATAEPSATPPLEPAAPLWRRALVGGGLVALTMVGMLLAAELFLRLFVSVSDVPLYFWDPVLGPRRAPNQAGVVRTGKHVRARYHFNGQGWNHPAEYTVARPAGARRVALVGDSYVEALSVDVDKAMFAVAEQRMSRPDRPVQWYAFGTSGWGTTQEYAALRHYILDYQPDVVILLFVQNDPFDSSPYLADLEPYVATYSLDEAGRLVLHPPGHWQPTWLRRTAVRSALVRYLAFQRQVGQPGGRGHGMGGGNPVREGAKAAAAGGLSAEERQRKTWQLVEQTLAAARDEARRRGAIFAVAYRGSLRDIDAPLAKGGVQPPLPREQDPFCLGARSDEMGRELVEPIAARLGIPYLDLTGPLRDAVARTGTSHHFPGDAHYNAMAHRAAGDALADWVERLWQEAPASAPAP